jgi:hypothetical protein
LKCGDEREKPTGQLHTCLEGKAIEKRRNFLSGGSGILVGDIQVECRGFDDRGYDPRCCLFFGFPETGLAGAEDLGSVFLGAAVFLVAVTIGIVGASVIS